MIVAYAGGSSLFCISQRGGVITFLVSTEGGHVFLLGVLLVAIPPPRRNNERSLRGIFFKAAKIRF